MILFFLSRLCFVKMTFKNICVDLIEKLSHFKQEKSMKFADNELYPLINLLGVVCYCMDVPNVYNSVGADNSEIRSLTNKIKRLEHVENINLNDFEIKTVIKCINLVLEDTEEDEFHTLTGITKIEMSQIQDKLNKILVYLTQA